MVFGRFGLAVISILSFSILLLIATTTAKESYYGESCNMTTPCVDFSSLICRNGSCVCAQPEAEMKYDAEAKQCLLLLGTPCTYPNSMDFNRNTRSNWVRYCGVNATCERGTNGAKLSVVCVCKQHFAEIPPGGGRCVQISGFHYHQPCQNTSQCIQEHGLSCINAQCDCDPALLGPKEVLGNTWCLGLVGKSCRKGNCVPNADCNYDNSICKCSSGYLPSVEGGGFCDSLSYGEQCVNREDGFTCNPRFRCNDGFCKCKYDTDHQYYDEGLGICRSLARGPCNSNADCTPNSECVSNGKTNATQCSCLEPYVETMKGFCDELEFGALCPPGVRSKCDQNGPLVCQDGICICEDGLKIFDPNTRKCRGIGGSICRDSNSCVKNSYCRKLQVDFPRGQCECFRNQKGDRTCAEPDDDI